MLLRKVREEMKQKMRMLHFVTDSSAGIVIKSILVQLAALKLLKSRRKVGNIFFAGRWG